MSTATESILDSYQAPLQSCDWEEPVPQSYTIYLAPGHSLQEHSAAIHQDIQPYVDHVYDSDDGKIICIGSPISDSLLEAIWSDRGAELVECEGVPQPDTECK